MFGHKTFTVIFVCFIFKTVFCSSRVCDAFRRGCLYGTPINGIDFPLNGEDRPVRL